MSGVSGVPYQVRGSSPNRWARPLAPVTIPISSLTSSYLHYLSSLFLQSSGHLRVFAPDGVSPAPQKCCSLLLFWLGCLGDTSTPKPYAGVCCGWNSGPWCRANLSYLLSALCIVGLFSACGPQLPTVCPCSQQILSFPHTSHLPAQGGMGMGAGQVGGLSRGYNFPTHVPVACFLEARGGRALQLAPEQPCTTMTSVPR